MNKHLDQLNAWFASSVDQNLRASLAEIILALEDELVPAWHPLGFIHAKLGQGLAGDTFRLHLWSMEHRDLQEQSDKIHDHLFDVRSRVVVGSIENIRYFFSPDPSGGHRLLRVAYQSSGSSLRETEIYGNLTPEVKEIYLAPTEYMVPRFELHETVVHTRLALTVVHTTNPAAYEPRAIFRRESNTPSPRVPIPCDKGLWRNLVESVLPI